MLRSFVLAGALAASLSAGCSRDKETTLVCETTDRYRAARSVPAVRVPDDLSVPDESDSLRLPPDPGAVFAAAGRCLEAPPAFFEAGRPGESAARQSAPASTEDAPADDRDRMLTE